MSDRHAISDIEGLIERIQQDAREFTVIVDYFQKPLFQFLAGFRLAPARLDELAQDVFVRVYQNLSSYDRKKGATFSSWVFTIAKRLAINEISKYEYKHRDTEYDCQTRIETTDDPASTLENEQKGKIVFGAINMLPEHYRNVLLLSYVRELNLEDIAVIEECSVGTVKSRLFRAKKKLVPVLSQLLEDPQEEDK